MHSESISKGNKLIVLSIALTASVLTLMIYLYPKLSLFDDNKRAWNFRNISKIFPSKNIHASEVPFRLKKQLISLENLTYTYNAQQLSMVELLYRTETTGLLVLKNNVIVYEEYFLGNTARDKNTSWSMAKSFISALVGIAISEGYIESINDPITKYMPELSKSGYSNVPIKHVLQMSSGVKFSEDYDNSSSDINNLLPQLFLNMRPIKKVVFDFPSENYSGQKFHYMSLDTQILGLLIERVTLQPVATYFEKKLWQPLGAESNATWLTDNYQTELTFCCLNATLRDFAKFGLLYMNDGYFNGRQIIPKNWVKESVVPDSAHLQVGATSEKYGRWGYQYQWWIPQGADGDYSAVGVWGQYIYVNPKKEVVIVKTSSGFTTPEVDDEVIALFRAITKGIK